MEINKEAKNQIWYFVCNECGLDEGHTPDCSLKDLLNSYHNYAKNKISSGEYKKPF